MEAIESCMVSISVSIVLIVDIVSRHIFVGSLRPVAGRPVANG